MIFRYTRFQFGSLVFIWLSRFWRLLMRFFRLSTGDLNVLSVILKLLELFKSRSAKCCDVPYVTNGPDFNFLSQMKIQSWQTRKKKKRIEKTEWRLKETNKRKNGQKNICSLRNGTKGSVNLAFEIVDSIRRLDRRHRSRVWETKSATFSSRSVLPAGR